VFSAGLRFCGRDAPWHSAASRFAGRLSRLRGGRGVSRQGTAIRPTLRRLAFLRKGGCNKIALKSSNVLFHYCKLRDLVAQPAVFQRAAARMPPVFPRPGEIDTSCVNSASGAISPRSRRRLVALPRRPWLRLSTYSLNHRNDLFWSLAFDALWLPVVVECNTGLSTRPTLQPSAYDDSNDRNDYLRCLNDEVPYITASCAGRVHHHKGRSGVDTLLAESAADAFEVRPETRMKNEAAHPWIAQARF
jgi:hypothetical protein